MKVFLLLLAPFTLAIRVHLPPQNVESAGDVDMEQYHTIIVGGGYSGMIQYVQMIKAGFDPSKLRIIEQNSHVGGVWETFGYPGVAVDSMFYAPRFEETREYYPKEMLPSGQAIRAYARKVAETFNITSQTWFDEKVTSAKYLETEKLWLVETNLGRKVKCQYVVMATGFASEERETGEIENFKGQVLYAKGHWTTSDLPSDGVVGLIGTGPAGAQILPKIKDHVKKVKVFMKNAHWNFPRPKGKLDEDMMNCVKYGDEQGCMQDLRQKLWLGPTNGSEAPSLEGKMADGMELLKNSVDDESIRKQLTPTEHPLCRRMIVNNEFWRSFQHPNVELIVVPEGVQQYGTDHVITHDEKHEVDTLIMATGYEFNALTHPVLGRGNKSLEGFAPSLYGSEFANFPNFFRIGPIKMDFDIASLLGSVTRQVDRTVRLMRKQRDEGFKTVEPTQEAVDRTTKQDWLDHKSSIIGECKSWVFRHASPTYVPTRFQTNTKAAVHITNREHIFS